MQVKDVCCRGTGRGEGTEVGMVEWCLVEDPENKHWAAGNRFEKQKKNEVTWIKFSVKKKKIIIMKGGICENVAQDMAYHISLTSPKEASKWILVLVLFSLKHHKTTEIHNH